MTFRDWTDSRDGRHWTIWHERGRVSVLAFGSGDDVRTVGVDFTDDLADRSDAELQTLLDGGRRVMDPSTGPSILILENDLDCAALIKAAFNKGLAHVNLHFVLDGWEAQAYLARESPYDDRERYPVPSLVVLDLRMPDIDAIEVLEWMAEWKQLAKVPVIAYTSEDPELERRAYELGVRCYISKPYQSDELVVAVRDELGLSALASTIYGAAQETETLPGQPRKVKRLTGLALFSLSLFEMTLIVVAYEAMRYASSSGVVPVPLYVMGISYIAISALVVMYFVTGVQRRRRAVETENERLIVALHRSLAEVSTLSGLLPICAHCKQVKDSAGYWHQIEEYIGSRSEAVFRHALCDACRNAVLPEDADQAG